MAERANSEGVYDKVINRYGMELDQMVKSSGSVVMDIVELWEDMSLVFPMLDDIAKCKMPTAELRSALIKVQARAWHISDHLASLSQAMDEQ